MQAAITERWGDPDWLACAEVERPRPQGEQAVLRVAACSLNYLDVLVQQGLVEAEVALPHVGGCDIVGTVEAVGPGADTSLVGRAGLVDPNIGSSVIGAGCWGGLAEYVVVPAGNVIPLGPRALEQPAAYAALPMAYGTAHRMLFAKASLREGEVVVVHGAGGGVGVACVQLALRAGAVVIACSTSDAKLERLRDLGARHTVNVGQEVLRRRVRDLTGGADVVVDYLGRDTWSESLRCLRPGGRVVTCGATTGHDAITDLRYVFSRELSVIGSNGWTREDLASLLAMVDAGELDAVVGAIFPLSKAAGAMAELASRRVFGKIVVVPDGMTGTRDR